MLKPTFYCTIILEQIEAQYFTRLDRYIIEQIKDSHLKNNLSHHLIVSKIRKYHIRIAVFKIDVLSHNLLSKISEILPLGLCCEFGGLTIG